MRPRKTFVLFSAALVIPVAAQTLPSCRVEAAVVSPQNSLGQYRVEIRVQQYCKSRQLVRIITAQGGKLPPLGYFPLGGGFPLYKNQWVFKGARVEVRLAPNVWVELPIRGASWQN